MTERQTESAPKNALEIYFRDINETPLLSPEEEMDLALRIQKGDMEARDHLIRANLRLVVNIAREFQGRGMSLQDLIEEGNLGLLHAVETYDLSFDTRFCTYASYWIKQSIRRALGVKSDETLPLPAYMLDHLTRWDKASSTLKTAGKKPNPAQTFQLMEEMRRREKARNKLMKMDEETEPSEDDIQKLVTKTQRAERDAIRKSVVKALQKTYGKNPPRSIVEEKIRMRQEKKTKTTLANIMKAHKARSMVAFASYGDEEQTEHGISEPADLRSKSPEEIAERTELIKNAIEWLDRINPRLRMVLSMRLGLGGNEPMTLNEIGQVLKITRERARQLEVEAKAEIQYQATCGFIVPTVDEDDEPKASTNGKHDGNGKQNGVTNQPAASRNGRKEKLRSR